MKKLFLTGIILIFSLMIGTSASAGGASLYLSSAGDSLGVGETVYMDVKINTGGFSINAAQVNISYPGDKLKITNVFKDGSIFSLWPDEPYFSNSEGKLYFSGGVPHPGFSGNNGQILRIQFEAKEEGEAILAFGKSQILADDGNGTNIFSRGFDETYVIKPSAPQIISSTHHEQNQWHKENDIKLNWELLQDVKKVSFSLDKNPETRPDEIPEGRLDSYAYKNIEDGIWFFHLLSNTEKGWSNPRHFKIMIDRTPPRPFEIVVDNGGDPTNPRPILYFDTEDLVSGVDRYVVKIGQGEDVFTETVPSNPFQTPLLAPGGYPVLVEAVDKAENSRQSLAKVEITPIQKPVINIWPQRYIAGEEVFYLEGTALPRVEVAIFLGKNGQNIKEWRLRSGETGEWSFSSKEILKSGFYQLSAMAKDERGAISRLSEEKTIEVDFSGIEFGPIMITLSNIAMFLFVILALGIIFIGFNNYKARRLKNALKKEAQEVRITLYQAFINLEKEVKRKIEMLDSQQGFNKQEKELYEDLLTAIKTAQDSIDKEILDVINQLR